MTGTPAPELTIVVPCFNEAPTLPELARRVVAALEGNCASFEILFVDDGSADATARALRELNAADPRARALLFSRNFGKEAALSAGLREARGRAVAMIDSDLQHPPEVLPQMIARWRAGAEVVAGVRTNRDTDPPWRRAISRAFYAVFNRLSDTRIVPDAGDFRLLDRKVVDALNDLPERARFMKGLYAWVGFRQETIPYDVAPRADGRTSFSPFKLLRFSVDAITAFSTLPLRVWTYVGTAILALVGLYVAYVAVGVLLHGRNVPGFASLLALVALMGGLQFLTLGILGEYIARIATETKNRPLYVVRERIGAPDRDQSDK